MNTPVYKDQLAEFIMNCFRAVPPESLLETTRNLIQDIVPHLAVLLRTLKESGRLSEDEFDRLRLDIRRDLNLEMGPLRIYNPLPADHALITDSTRCAVCHESFKPLDRTTVIPLDITGRGGTVEALAAHAGCITGL